MRKVPLVAVVPSVLLMTGCSASTTVAANVGLQFPEQAGGYLWAHVYGPPLLAALAILVGVVVLITLLTTVRAARRGHAVRRGQVAVSVVAVLVLIIAAAAELVVSSVPWSVFG